MAVVTIIVFIASSSGQTTQPPRESSSLLTLTLPPGHASGSAPAAGWRRAHPSLFSMAGRQIILYTRPPSSPVAVTSPLTLLVLTSDTSVCLFPSHSPRTSSRTPSACWGSTHRKTRSDDATTSAGVPQTVTTPGNAAARADDLASDRRVTEIDSRDTPAPSARWRACSGEARDEAMADAIVPQPMKPALRGIEPHSSPPWDMATLKASAMATGWRNSR
mmetsp:Transcript_8341/g.19126  ORF Transcript_8341/g.19126 Transcript_8341/m.19126 type:complete len:219 (-) Transcript_8341:78-734(-)